MVPHGTFLPQTPTGIAFDDDMLEICSSGVKVVG